MECRRMCRKVAIEEPSVNKISLIECLALYWNDSEKAVA